MMRLRIFMGEYLTYRTNGGSTVDLSLRERLPLAEREVYHPEANNGHVFSGSASRSRLNKLSCPLAGSGGSNRFIAVKRQAQRPRLKSPRQRCLPDRECSFSVGMQLAKIAVPMIWPRGSERGLW